MSLDPEMVDDLETLESALEILEDALGPCDDDCPCIIHPMVALVARIKAEPLQVAAGARREGALLAAARDLLSALRDLEQAVNTVPGLRATPTLATALMRAEELVDGSASPAPAPEDAEQAHYRSEVAPEMHRERLADLQEPKEADRG